MKQLDYYEVKNLKQAKVLSHELRMKIISMFVDDKPRTAKQIADELEMAAPKVHYHVKELEKLGLLILTETKINGGIVEKYYLPIAKNIRIRLSRTEGEGIYEFHEQSEIINKTLREFRNSFLKSMEEARKNEEFFKPLFFQMQQHLSEEERDELYNELKELSEKWNERTNTRKTTVGKEEFSLLLSFYKIID